MQYQGKFDFVTFIITREVTRMAYQVRLRACSFFNLSLYLLHDVFVVHLQCLEEIKLCCC